MRSIFSCPRGKIYPFTMDWAKIEVATTKFLNLSDFFNFSTPSLWIGQKLKGLSGIICKFLIFFIFQNFQNFLPLHFGIAEKITRLITWNLKFPSNFLPPSLWIEQKLRRSSQIISQFLIIHLLRCSESVIWNNMKTVRLTTPFKKIFLLFCFSSFSVHSPFLFQLRKNFNI